jgi:predicted secreted protein
MNARNDRTWRSAVAVLIATLAALAFGACVTADVSITEADRDGDVAARRGDYVSIALPADPDSGLAWVITSVDSTILRQQHAPTFIARSDVGDAPGVDLFRYRAIAEGETSITLEYQRTTEGVVETLDSFGVTVSVGLPVP